MSKREQVLAMAVGLLLGMLVVFYMLRLVSQTIGTKQDRIYALKKEVRDKQRTVRFGRPVMERTAVYQRRSLPSNVERARTLYQTWLLDLVTEKIDLHDPNVSTVSSPGTSEVFHQLAFTVTGQGDLRQLVQLLHEFYSVDYLHRIRRLHVKRIAGSKRLDLSLSVDALSLQQADSETELSVAVADRLKYGALEEYLRVITGRNLSGPENQEPDFGPIAVSRAYTGERVQFVVKARDPDSLDSLTYELKADPLYQADLDSKSGEFRWTPDEPGEYEFEFIVSDDGMPAHVVSKKVKVEVEDKLPEPEPEPEPPRKPSFEDARFAHVNAIVQGSGERQVWITMRKEGTVLKLSEGDTFRVGEVEVAVKRIDDEQVELEAKVLDKRLSAKLDQTLAEATEMAFD